MSALVPHVPVLINVITYFYDRGITLSLLSQKYLVYVHLKDYFLFIFLNIYFFYKRIYTTFKFLNLFLVKTCTSVMTHIFLKTPGIFWISCIRILRLLQTPLCSPWFCISVQL